jgi:hypothetical protein
MDLMPPCAPAPAGVPVVYATASLLSSDIGNGWQEMLAVFNPLTLQVSEWIPLKSCNDTFLDMAVDSAGRILLAGANGYYWFDRDTKVCTTIRRAYEDPSGDPDKFHNLFPPNNITFAPADLFDAAPVGQETLVAFGFTLKDDTDTKSYEAGYMRIVPETGDTRVVSPWPTGPDGRFSPSGDLVTVTDKCNQKTRAWAPVIGPDDSSLCRACKPGQKAGLDCGDCLYEFTLKDGAFTKNLGLLPYASVYGLAFWGGVLVGFTMDGHIISIDPTQSPPKTTGVAVRAPEGYQQVVFNGAGSSTAAPLVQ